jgi:hypothetical protein
VIQRGRIHRQRGTGIECDRTGREVSKSAEAHLATGESLAHAPLFLRGTGDWKKRVQCRRCRWKSCVHRSPRSTPCSSPQSLGGLRGDASASPRAPLTKRSREKEAIIVVACRRQLSAFYLLLQLPIGICKGVSPDAARHSNHAGPWLKSQAQDGGGHSRTKQCSGVQQLPPGRERRERSGRCAAHARIHPPFDPNRVNGARSSLPVGRRAATGGLRGSALCHGDGTGRLRHHLRHRWRDRGLRHREAAGRMAGAAGAAGRRVYGSGLPSPPMIKSNGRWQARPG